MKPNQQNEANKLFIEGIELAEAGNTGHGFNQIREALNAGADANMVFESEKGEWFEKFKDEDHWMEYDGYDRSENIAYFPAVLRIADIPGSEMIQLEMIAKFGANPDSYVDSPSDYGLNVLHKAKSPLFVELLIAQGCEMGGDTFYGSPFNAAIMGRDFALAEAHLQNRNGRQTPEKTLRDSQDYLLRVEVAGQAQYLLDKGVDVNMRDSYGNTPLHYAAEKLRGMDEEGEIVAVLLKYGADPEALNIAGKTPRDYAAKLGIDKGHFYDTLLQQHQANSPSISNQREHGRDHSPSFSR